MNEEKTVSVNDGEHTTFTWKSDEFNNPGNLTYKGTLNFMDQPPPIVGWWVLPGSKESYWTGFAAHCKPNWLHRFMMEKLMGWKYKEE